MSNWEEVVNKAEELMEKKDISGCHACLEEAYKNGIQHPQVLWRYARAKYEVAEETTDKKVRAPLLTEGLELCKKSVAEDPNNFASHKWLGILISAQSELISTKEKIANAYTIRDEFLKAIELNPKDANSQHCMGKWCWTITQIGWMERQAASLLFGEPPTSSYEDCLKYLLAASAIEDTIHNSILIGDVYYQQKKYADAKQWYQKALDLPAASELQKRQHADAQKKLASC